MCSDDKFIYSSSQKQLNFCICFPMSEIVSAFQMTTKEVGYFCESSLFCIALFWMPSSPLCITNFIRLLCAIRAVVTMGRKWLIEAAYWYNRAGCGTWQERWSDGLQLMLCKNIQPWNMHLRVVFWRCVQNANNLCSKEMCKLKTC